MLAVRVHLDDCGQENGPLRVLPGSHRFGWLEEQLDDWKQRVPEVVCTIGRGGVVTMCPLVLHASAKSAAVGHRRVIHIEYACDTLPERLEWNNRVGPLGRDQGIMSPMSRSSRSHNKIGREFYYARGAISSCYLLSSLWKSLSNHTKHYPE